MTLRCGWQVISLPAWIKKGAVRLDITLQIGAHRTASTSFQTYLRKCSGALSEQGVGFWGPLRLRNGMMHGVIPDPLLGQGALAFSRAQGRIALNVQRSQACGLSDLIVSDENMLGSMRNNIAMQCLYPGAGERIARYVAAFRGCVKAICLSVRCQSNYWPSALSFCIPRGVRVLNQKRINALVAQPRDWRDVITDVVAAAPGVPVFVATYEQFGNRPSDLMSYLLGRKAPRLSAQVWRNQRPSAQDLLTLPLGNAELERLSNDITGTRWDPFTSGQRAAFQERYADDLFWLRSGGDGLAHFLEDPTPSTTRESAQMGYVNKGQNYDTKQRLARPG